MLISLAWAAPLGARQEAPSAATSVFTILSGGRVIGGASTTVTESAEGWSISARETLGEPFQLATSRLLVRYSPDWRPLALSVEGTLDGQALTLTTTIAGTAARSEGFWHGRQVAVTQPISTNAVVLAADLFPAYEALAAQLPSASSGSKFRLYIAPQGEVEAAVTRVAPHRLITPSGPIDLQEYDLTLFNPGAPLAMEIWIDRQHRLARLAIPASWLVVLRDDISSVMAREERVTRPGDQEVLIPALGFSLAGTLSAPAGRTGRAPAVILVGAPGRQDRDEVTGDIPVFGLLANALADAGFVVVRYDKRGAGRSGGRVESATLADYVGDALSVVRWLRQRPEVDRDRVGIVGYAEGGATALLAAAQEKHVATVCLLAAAGQPGRDIVLLQQERALARSSEPQADRLAKVALERRVIDAVIKGTGWTDIPPDVRHQADTPWFKSWLLFDPAAAMKKIKQPVLILSGAFDTQFPPAQADRLEALARQRKKLPERATRKVIVPGVNHLLVAAPSGDEDDDSKLTGAPISPVVTSTVVEWLQASMAGPQ